MSLNLVPFEDAPREEDLVILAQLPQLRRVWYKQGRLGCYLCGGQVKHYRLDGIPNVCETCSENEVLHPSWMDG